MPDGQAGAKAFLIDFENIGNRWAEALDGAGPGDLAVLFYSDNSPKAMLDQLEKLERRGLSLKFRKCAIGKNGLDFQLASELGYLIHSGMWQEFYIISGDSGYDVLGPYWASSGVAVSRAGLRAQEQQAQEPAGPAQMQPGMAMRTAEAWLDEPMTQMGLSRPDRGHVLGCAKACLQELQDPEARWEKFRSDTRRIKGNAMWQKLEAGLGPVLKPMFGFMQD